MAESAESALAAGSDSTPARTPAPKDKHCSYCGQLFTSSSLGRHLDLYIKEKNPKPPDGVHDIEEIRRMRGGITRRSARTSSVKRESLTPAHSKPSPPGSQRSASDAGQGGSCGAPMAPALAPAPAPAAPSAASAPARQPMRGFNEPSWRATGVMRDIPPASSEPAASGVDRMDGRRDSVRKVKTGIEHKEKMREVYEQGRAAELALREVLDSVRVAT